MIIGKVAYFSYRKHFSTQQEQNSARWIKEQEETQNMETQSVFFDSTASNSASHIQIEGYLFKRSHQKVILILLAIKCGRLHNRNLSPLREFTIMRHMYRY